MKKKARITSVSISRLYSLGNYEHIKFELSAEVPKGVSASKTLFELGSIVGRLAPLKRPYNLEVAKATLNKCSESLTESEKANLQEYRELVQSYETARSLRIAAIEKLDDLGGSSKTGGGRKDDFEEDAPW